MKAIFSCTSCEYGTVQLFSDKDLEWMEAYSDGDTIPLSDSTSIEIDGETCTDAYLIDDKCSHLSGETETNCDYFIWSKSKGLVQYKYLNGDTYTFYKKIPCKKK